MRYQSQTKLQFTRNAIFHIGSDTGEFAKGWAGVTAEKSLAKWNNFTFESK